MITIKVKPPDGGYGWVIVFAFGLNGIIILPILQGLGLLFKDIFKDLEFSSQQIGLIMNSGAAISMSCAIFNTPLLKYFGYRKVSIISATLMTAGVLLTAYATRLSHYILFYGFLASYGVGMSMASYSLAINYYFKEKRAKAFGYAMAFSGLGPIVMPQVVSYLISTYGERGAIIILGGIASHTFISAILLQPVRWHMKEETIWSDKSIDKELTGKDNKDVEIFQPKANRQTNKLTLPLKKYRSEVETIYCAEQTLDGSISSLYYRKHRKRSMSLRLPKNPFLVSYRTLPRASKILRSPSTPHELEIYIDEDKYRETEKKQGENEEDEQEEKIETNFLKKTRDYFIEIYDLTLLRDPTYVLIIVGLSFVAFAEMNASVLTPFIMEDCGLVTQQIATFMSVRAIANICCRILAPYVSNFYKLPARIMFMWSLLFLIISRSCLLLAYEYPFLLGCAFFMGAAKGFRTVYWSLVIPEYVPIERLIAASGIQSTLNSILLWIGGSLVGLVKDLLGSYKYCIVVINIMTSITLVMWLIEFLCKRLKSGQRT